MRFLYIILVFCACLFARENPFMPSNINESNLQSSNIVDRLPPFTPKVFSFPKSARDIDRIVIYYKNITGDLKREVIEVNESFNSNESFILDYKRNIQRYIKNETKLYLQEKEEKQAELEKTMRKITIYPDISVEEEDLPKKVEDSNSSIKIAKTFQEEKPKQIEEKPVLTAKSEIKFKNFINLKIYENYIIFDSKDEMIKFFVTSNPNKIAIDFHRNAPNFATKSYKDKLDSIKLITFGAHEKFYRITVLFDSKKDYKITKLPNGGAKLSF